MSKADEAYLALASMIENEEVDAEELYTEAALADLIGFGRTPVREAVQRLDRDHLVVVHPGRGIEIPRANVDDQLRRLEVRRSLESLAATLCCERATDRDLERIAGLYDRLEQASGVEEYISVVRQTHEIMSAAAHNDYLAEAMRPLQVLSRRFWLTHLDAVDSVEDSIRRGGELHRKLIVALGDRDAKKAREVSRKLNTYLVEYAFSVARRYVRSDDAHEEETFQ